MGPRAIHTLRYPDTPMQQLIYTRSVSCTYTNTGAHYFALWSFIPTQMLFPYRNYFPLKPYPNTGSARYLLGIVIKYSFHKTITTTQKNSEKRGAILRCNARACEHAKTCVRMLARGLE